jgi:hypothetical protein
VQWRRGDRKPTAAERQPHLLRRTESIDIALQSFCPTFEVVM